MTGTAELCRYDPDEMPLRQTVPECEEVTNQLSCGLVSLTM